MICDVRSRAPSIYTVALIYSVGSGRRPLCSPEEALDPDQRDLIAVSYAWIEPGNCDVDGFHLSRIAAALHSGHLLDQLVRREITNTKGTPIHCIPWYFHSISIFFIFQFSHHFPISFIFSIFGILI